MTQTYYDRFPKQTARQRKDESINNTKYSFISKEFLGKDRHGNYIMSQGKTYRKEV